MGTPFVFQPYLSRGSATPCVARTIPQTSNLVQAFPLPEEKRKAIIEISHEVMLRLIACLDQADYIVAQVEAGKKELLEKGVVFNEGGTATQLPAVVDLRQHVELFLYAAKGALRDIGALFVVFYDRRFKHRFDKAREWLEATYGPKDQLLVALKADASWIEQILNMRTAVDDPGTPSVLNLDNFKLVAISPPEVAPPTWRLDEGGRAAIVNDMPVLVDNLLTLFEDILADGLLRLQPTGPFVIHEVPEEERDPDMPIRLRIGLAKPIQSA